MLIWLILLLVAPGIFAALYFEHIMEQKNSLLKQTTIGISFAFFINLFTTTIIWLRGYENIYWSLDDNSILLSVSFCVKYMVISTAFAVLLPWVVAMFSTIKNIKLFRMLLGKDKKND
jgi:hypothetical protein